MVSVRISAVVPRQNTFGSRYKMEDRNGDADGHSLLAARVGPKALQCQRMKHGETAGTGGDENMKWGGDSVSPYLGC